MEDPDSSWMAKVSFLTNIIKFVLVFFFIELVFRFIL